MGEAQSNKRTKKQNNSIHLFCTLLSEAFDEAGLDMRAVLKPEVEIPWTPDTVKRHLWHPIQKLYLPHTIGEDGEVSTKNLDKKEVDKVYEVINRHLAPHGVHVPFPSIDYAQEEQM
jgi:hypothetical protein